MKPKYVKCISVWAGRGRSIVGRIYDTDIPNDFSRFTWETIYNRITGTDPNGYFKETTEEEYSKQEFPETVINNTYPIY